MLDAPVLGSEPEARNGHLTVLAGCRPEDLSSLDPLLSDLAAFIYHVGAVGDGTRLKLANNMGLAIVVAGLAEAMDLIAATGIDQSIYARVLAETGVGNRVLAGKAQLMATSDYRPRFTIRNMLKDISLAQDLAASVGQVAALGKQVRNLYDEAVKQGWADSDHGAIYESVKKPVSDPSQ